MVSDVAVGKVGGRYEQLPNLALAHGQVGVWVQHVGYGVQNGATDGNLGVSIGNSRFHILEEVGQEL